MTRAATQQAALLTARRRRIQLELDRSAKARRAVQAIHLARVRQQELANAEAALDRARKGLGAALHQLVVDIDLDGACANTGLTQTEVRSLIRRSKAAP